jgi:hypothetical protein
MSIFGKRPAADPYKQERQIQEAKRIGSQLERQIHGRIEDGTASKDDKRIWNAGRKRSDRIK